MCELRCIEPISGLIVLSLTGSVYCCALQRCGEGLARVCRARLRGCVSARAGGVSTLKP
jgi:hypothetical protein